MTEDIFAKQRARAADLTIDGPYPGLAREFRRLLGWEVGSTRPFISTHGAEAKTGVNYTTIGRITRGFPVKLSTFERLGAIAADANVHKLMLLAGIVPPEMMPVIEAGLLDLSDEIRNLFATEPAFENAHPPTDPETLESIWAKLQQIRSKFDAV